MSVESQDSFSNKLDQLRKSTVQDKQLTRLKGYISTGFPCDKKNLPTDPREFWPHKEMLSIESGLWKQNHSAKRDEARNAPVHTQETPRQGEMSP